MHELAGKELDKNALDNLRNNAKRIIEDNLQGYRDVEEDKQGRLFLSNVNLKEENETQQILSLLMAERTETDALMGRSMESEMPITLCDARERKILQEAVANGLVSPTQLAQTASAFRGNANISTDDLTDKWITDIQQIGNGYDPKTRAAHNYQIKESGHDLDHNLHPETANNVDNVYQQARRENKVTAASAKENVIASKYKSIIALRNNALKMIQDQYARGYRDPGFDDNAEELDIYGSALDDLIQDIQGEKLSSKRRSKSQNRSQAKSRAQAYKNTL